MAGPQDVVAKVEDALAAAARCSTDETTQNYDALAQELQDLAELARLSCQSHDHYGSLIGKLRAGDALSAEEMAKVCLLFVGDADYYVKYDVEFARCKSELAKIVAEIDRLKQSEFSVNAFERSGPGRRQPAGSSTALPGFAGSGSEVRGIHQSGCARPRQRSHPRHHYRRDGRLEGVKVGDGREGPSPRSSLALHALGAGRHIVEGERHRDAGVEAYQGDDVGDADMAQRLDRAVIEPLRYPARITEANCHLVDDLLALVGERSRQARQDRLDLVVRQPGRLAGPFVRIGRVGRMPFAVDDAHGDLALALAERVARAEMRTKLPHHLGQLGVVHIDLVRAGQPAARLDQRAIALLLLRRHLVVRDLGIAAKGGRVGHFCLLR